MTRDEAHELLDAARAGLPVSSSAIMLALRATGDLGAARRHPAPEMPSQWQPADPLPAWQPSKQVLTRLRNAPYHARPEAA